MKLEVVVNEKENGGAEPPIDEELRREICEFVDQNRARALWWMRADYYPQTPADARDVLEAVARRCRRSDWIKARQLARRLS